MSIGSTLLTLQELDLSLERDRAELADMPEIKELARKRRAYVKLKSELTKLTALRKDIETDLSDLDEDEKFCNAAIEQAQNDMNDPSNFHAVRDFELQLAGIAKRMDKISYSRTERLAALEEAVAKERQAADYIARFEKTVVNETRAARDRAAEIQKSIDSAAARREAVLNTMSPELKECYEKASKRFKGLFVERLEGNVPSVCRTSLQPARREAVLNTMSPELKECYEKASKRFKGLFVERLEGNVPSVCRTSLQPSSMDELANADEVGECPYCHRLIVISSVEGE